MHVSPSTLSRQIQRLEEDLGQPLFVRDNRTVTLTEAGEELRIFAQQTLLQYQQLRHHRPAGAVAFRRAAYFLFRDRCLQPSSPILDRFRAEHPSVEIKLTTGDAADAMEKVVTGEADLAIAGKPETLPGAVAFSMLENLAVVLIAPALPCRCATGLGGETGLVDGAVYHGRSGAGAPPHRAVVPPSENQQPVDLRYRQRP